MLHLQFLRVFWKWNADYKSGSPIFEAELPPSTLCDSDEEWLAILKNLQKACETLFSKDEILEDITSGSLKFLLLPYFLGDFLINNSERKEGKSRIDQLDEAFFCYSIFLENLKRIGLKGDDFKKASNPEELRALKVKWFRQKKDLLLKIKELPLRSLFIFNKKEEEIDFDEERELWENILVLARIEILSSQSVLEQERELLLLKFSEEEVSKGEEILSKLDGDGNVKKKPFILQIRDKAELQRYLNSRVFQPSHNLPTMSLAEAAAIEMYQDVHQLGGGRRKKEDRLPSVSSDFENEDDASDQNDNIHKIRAWDEWKDENPRGSGNTQCNRG